MEATGATDARAHDPERQERLEAEALTYLDPLYRTALRLSRNPQDAEDLVQEAYLNAFRALDRFEEGTNLRAWLFRILNNAFISQYRRRKRRPSSSLDEVSDFYLYDHLVAGNTAPPQENPEREVLSRIGDEAVLQALEELPVEFRQVELLADVEGFSYREIADILGIPIGTVMSRLYRGRRRLQQRLWREAQQAGYDAPSASAGT
jgi:RNA polymerase sigma-70 factor, ECF subfamily